MTDSLQAVKNADSSTTTPGITASSGLDRQPAVMAHNSEMTSVINDLKNSVLQVKSHATREMNGPDGAVSNSDKKSSSVIVPTPHGCEGNGIKDFLSEFGHLADVFMQEQDLLSGNSKAVPPHPNLSPADLLAFFTVLAAAVEHNKTQKHSPGGVRPASADQKCVGVGTSRSPKDQERQPNSTKQNRDRNPPTVQTSPRQHAEKLPKASEDSPSAKQLPCTMKGSGTKRNNVDTAVEDKELRLGDLVSQLRDTMSPRSPMESVPTERMVNMNNPASHTTAPRSDITSSDATPPSNEPPDPDTRSKKASDSLPSNTDSRTTTGAPGVQVQPEPGTPPKSIPIESEPKPSTPAAAAQARVVPGTAKRTLPPGTATGSPARPVQGSAGIKTAAAMWANASGPVKPRPAAPGTPGRVAPTAKRVSGTIPASQRVMNGTASAEQRPEARPISPPMNATTSQQKIPEPTSQPIPSYTESEPEPEQPKPSNAEDKSKPEGPSGLQPVLARAAHQSPQGAPANTDASITSTDHVVDTRTTEPQVQTLNASKEDHEQQTPSQVPEQVTHVTETPAQSANDVLPQMDNEPLPDSQVVAAQEVPGTQATTVGMTEPGQVTVTEQLPDQAESSVQRPQNSQTGASEPARVVTHQPASQEQHQQTTAPTEAVDSQTSAPPRPPTSENGTASVESDSGAPGVSLSQQEQARARTAGPVNGTRAAPTAAVRARPVAQAGPGARPAQPSTMQPGARPPAGAVAARPRPAAAAGSSPAGNAAAANGARPQGSQAAPPPGQAKAPLAARPRPATGAPGTSAMPRTAPTARAGAGPATAPGSAARVAVKRPPQAGASGAAAQPRPQAAANSATNQAQSEAPVVAPSTVDGQKAPSPSTEEPEAVEEQPADSATGTTPEALEEQPGGGAIGATPEAEKEQPGESATGTTPEAVNEQPVDSTAGTTPESKPIATRAPQATRPAGAVPPNGTATGAIRPAVKAQMSEGLAANAPNGAHQRPGSTTGPPAQNPVTPASAGPRPPGTASAPGQVRPRPTGQPSAPANSQGRSNQAAQQLAQANGRPTRPPGAPQPGQAAGQARQTPPGQQSAPANGRPTPLPGAQKPAQVNGRPTRPPGAPQPAQAAGQARQIPPGQQSAPANGQARPVPVGQQSAPVPSQARQMPVAQQQPTRPMPRPLQQPQAVADASNVAPERRHTHELKSIEAGFKPPSRFSLGLRSHSHEPHNKPLPPLPPGEDEDFKPSRRSSWWRRHFGGRRDEEWELRAAPQPQFRPAAPQLRAMSANQPQFRVAPAQAAMQPMAAQNGYGGAVQQQPRPMGSVMGGAGMGIVPPQQAAPVYAPEQDEYDPYEYDDGGYDNGGYDNGGYDNGGYDGAPPVAAPARTAAAGMGTVTGDAGMGLVGGAPVMDDAGGWDDNGVGYGDRFVDDGFEEPQQQQQPPQPQQYQGDGTVQYYN